MPRLKTIAAILWWAKYFLKHNFGYSQPNRWAGIREGKPHEPGDFDCTSIIGAILFLAGYVPGSLIAGTWFSGNLADKLGAVPGWRKVSAKGKSLAWLRRNVTAGAVLVGPGHGVLGMGGGYVLSWESSEKATHDGKVGRQPGERVVKRSLYLRSRGWEWLLLPPADAKPVYRYPTLKRGSRGDLVLLWKRAVKRRHPILAAKYARRFGEGHYRITSTYRAVDEALTRRIEERAGRKATGKVGHWMWRHLGLAMKVRREA